MSKHFIFLRNADVVVTMDEEKREIEDGAVLVEDNQILNVGTTKEVEEFIEKMEIKVDETIDCAGTVVLPGFINCHHHLYQTLTRTVGTGEGLELFDWLTKLYLIWGKMDGEAVYVSAKLGLCELIMSGATTVADHLYLFPNGAKLDDEIRAAQELGVRFHPTRGSMTLGRSKGGLPPDEVTEDEEAILEDSKRLIETYHDPKKYSMLRMNLAPCSPFSVTASVMKKSAELARKYEKVGLHTHLCETKDEEEFCLKMFGKRPLDYVKDLGWTGDNVWFAHSIYMNDEEIDVLAKTKTGICHCPSSNCILGSGIAPIVKMLKKDVKVSLGVDGSASNDGNHMLGEVRQALFMQRVKEGAKAFSCRQALEIATLGGAKVLQRSDDLGRIQKGYAADIIAFRIDGIEHAGGQCDKVASLVTCAPVKVWLSIINGKVKVRNYELLGVDLKALIKRHNEISEKMINGSK
jgi:8-oxoguanine deaminase